MLGHKEIKNRCLSFMGRAVPTAPLGESENRRGGRWGSGPKGDNDPFSHICIHKAFGRGRGERDRGEGGRMGEGNVGIGGRGGGTYVRMHTRMHIRT